jgi:hypothetical protein
MTTHDPLLPAVVLQRKAVVYVRQSTPQQVQSNLESQRRQYQLVEVARRRGFTNIEVIDDDLGRTASGAVERPGFDRLTPCAPDRLARCSVSRPRDSRAMDVIGIICSSCADWWKPASSTSMAFTTRADRTTAYCSA